VKGEQSNDHPLDVAPLSAGSSRHIRAVRELAAPVQASGGLPTTENDAEASDGDANSAVVEEIGTATEVSSSGHEDTAANSPQPQAQDGYDGLHYSPLSTAADTCITDEERSQNYGQADDLLDLSGLMEHEFDEDQNGNVGERTISEEGSTDHGTADNAIVLSDSENEDDVVCVGMSNPAVHSRRRICDWDDDDLEWLVSLAGAFHGRPSPDEKREIELLFKAVKDNSPIVAGLIGRDRKYVSSGVDGQSFRRLKNRTWLMTPRSTLLLLSRTCGWTK